MGSNAREAETSAAQAQVDAAAAPEAGADEMGRAVHNALKLSLSMLGTIIVAMAVRILIPRYTGPTVFGQLNFADSFAAGFFVYTSFGVDSYIRKEVSTRLAHANDFWAGFWLLRLLSAVVMCVAMGIGLHAMHKGPLEWRLVYIFAAGQVAFVHNYTVMALLQAASEVGELSFMNVVSKLIWGGGIWASLLLGLPVEAVALAFLISEALKAIYLSKVVRNKLHLRWNVDMAATWAVMVASFPYFLNYMCHKTYEKINVIMLSAMLDDNEVGWYSAALNIVMLSLMFLPILQAVLVPMAARIGKQSIEAMNELMRNAVRLVLVGGTLISLIIMLNADDIVHLAFGAEYAESAQSLRFLAPMFLFTYLAVLGAMHLIQLDRIWTMTKVSLAALIINPLLNAPLIHWGASLGPGWGGAMSAVASICTEGANAVITFSILGRAAVDAKLWRVVGMTALVCGSVTAVHYVALPLGLWRIVPETLTYCALALATGAVPLTDLRRFLQNAVRSRRGQ